MRLVHSSKKRAGAPGACPNIRPRHGTKRERGNDGSTYSGPCQMSNARNWSRLARLRHACMVREDGGHDVMVSREGTSRARAYRSRC